MNPVDGMTAGHMKQKETGAHHSILQGVLKVKSEIKIVFTVNPVTTFRSLL